MSARRSDFIEYDLNDQATTTVTGPTRAPFPMQMDNGDIGYSTFETQVFDAYMARPSNWPSRAQQPLCG
jgi:hypothetical protein